jgi:hypothetical protein
MSLTLARAAGSFYRPVCDAFTVSALLAAMSTGRDLLLEMVALRHQLAVLGRSNRRFRPSDRLFWVCLRRWWPRWKDWLVLIRPRLPVGGVKDSDGWGIAHGGGRDDHASKPSFEASFSVWRWKTVSGAPRESTASC